MSGFLERLALRGAGLAPPGSPAPMRLRPRGRFEPGPGAVGPPDDRVDAPASIRPSPWSAEAERGLEPGPARPPERGAGPAPERRAPAEQAPPVARFPGPDPAPARADAIVAEEPAATEPVFDPASPIGLEPRGEATIGPQSVPDPPAPAPARAPAPAAFADAPGEIAPEPAEPAAMRDSASPAVPVRWRSERAERLEAGQRSAAAPPLTLRSRPDPAPAPVTVSIGRIDVEFVHPAAPPVAAAAPAVDRTRGFSSYARARRGSPR